MNVLVLGAGQLARMMALATKPLNINIRAYDVNSDTVVDPLSTERAFGQLNDGIEFANVITAEFEHIPDDVLNACQASGKLKPSAQAIKTGGDRRIEKALLESCNVANAKHRIIETKADFESALTELEFPLILKSALAGYDGKGQWRLKSSEQAEAVWLDIQDFFDGAKDNDKQGVIAEQMVPFDREVSLVGMRNSDGEIKVYPLTENHHTDGVLSVSTAIIDSPELQTLAHQAFVAIANSLNYVGTLAIEFFQVGDKLLVNELAPRVHNSGHWTQQGCDVCQFENHIRAVCNLPLGNTELNRPTAMINVLGEDSLPQALMAIPSVSIHWYGKSKRPGRKMGHINVSGNTQEELIERLKAAAELLDETAFEDIKGYIAKR